jgi:RNase H-like domain found in reverse transcriptase/Integrase zinc binding domain
MSSSFRETQGSHHVGTDHGAPKFCEGVTVHTDASKVASGATLEQDHGVIAFMSKKFSSTQRKYCAGDRELLAIVQALAAWRYYLLSTQVILYTDHLNLTRVYKAHSGRVARYGLLLAEFDLDVRHVPGKLNVAADALSRLTIASLWRPLDAWLLEMQRTLTEVSGLVRRNDGMWCRKYKNGKLVPFIPQTCRTRYLTVVHEENGHVGYRRALHELILCSWWSTQRIDLRECIQSCHHCQIHQTTIRPDRHGEYKKIPRGQRPFQVVAIDHVGPLPTATEGHQFIMTALCTY